MPQDWFPIDSNLGTKPEVQRVVQRLGDNAHVSDVIGPLVMLWGLVDQHAVPIDIVVEDDFDGILPDYDRRMVARICGGGEQLWIVIERETGWLQFTEPGVLIRGFVRRFGVGSKTRARAALRKQVSRALLVTDVTESVTRPGPEERTGKESKSSGPGRDESFGSIAAAVVAEVDSQPVPVRSGPGEKSFPWKAWDEVANAIDIPLPAMIGKAMSGQVSRALKVPSKGARNALSLADVQHVGEWLTWQATQDWPYRQPVTKAAFVALVAVILAKRDSAPEQPGAAVIALLMGKPTNSRNEPVDRAAEWRQAKARAPDALALVEKLLNPSAAPPKTTAADQKKDNEAAELAALAERHGPTLDSMGKDALLELAESASDKQRPTLIRSIHNGHMKAVRTALLRLLAQRAAS